MIYLDYNATAPLCPAAREAMEPYLQKHFGNPSSVHCAGREARAAIDNARDQLAALLGARPNELIFTSGGTEANNLALLGLARQNAPNGKHLISNRAEHHAVLNTLEHLEEKEGFEVTWLDVSSDGLVDPVQLSAAIRPDTTLVSIMTANNETGVLQPIKEIAARCRDGGVLLHSDMVQSFGKISAPPDVAGGTSSRSSSLRRRKLRRAQILRSEGRRLSLFARGVADRSDSVWRRARRRTPARNGERRRHRRDGCGRAIRER